MIYTNIRLYTSNGIPEALCNLWNGKDLLNRLKQMKIFQKITADRKTEKKVRFKTIDCWGNESYFEIIR